MADGADDTQTRLSDYVASEFLGERGTVDPDEDLLAAGILDSMGIMEIVGFIEEELGLLVEDEDIVPDNFRTLRALSELVAAKQRASSTR